MEKIYIETEFIKLDSLLKFASITQTGGHSKFLIKSNLVSLNDIVVTERGKKIRNGDIVKVYDEENDSYVSIQVLQK